MRAIEQIHLLAAIRRAELAEERGIVRIGNVEDLKMCSGMACEKSSTC